MSLLEARTEVLAMPTSLETGVQREQANLMEVRLKKAVSDRQKVRVAVRSQRLAEIRRGHQADSWRKYEQVLRRNNVAKRLDFLNLKRMRTLYNHLDIKVIVSLFYRPTPFGLVTHKLYL